MLISRFVNSASTQARPKLRCAPRECVGQGSAGASQLAPLVTRPCSGQPWGWQLAALAPSAHTWEQGRKPCRLLLSSVRLVHQDLFTASGCCPPWRHTLGGVRASPASQLAWNNLQGFSTPLPPLCSLLLAALAALVCVAMAGPYRGGAGCYSTDSTKSFPIAGFNFRDSSKVGLRVGQPT